LAGEINSAMPEYVVHQVVAALNDRRKALNGSKVLVVGLAYKADVDDDRESPSYVLMTLLKERGAQVSYYDPYVPVIKLTREHPQWAGVKSIYWEEKTIKNFDLALIATKHAEVDYPALAQWADCIVDTRNAMAGIPTREGQVRKA
jgi:UDP-N-acetyl-D-glucosamine dehydrogenase